MAIKGITKRWVLNSLGLILAILLALVLCFCFCCARLLFNGIQQTMIGYINSLGNLFDDYTGSTADFNAVAREYVQNFPDKERMELMVFNYRGNILLTSTGFRPIRRKTCPITTRRWARAASTACGTAGCPPANG